MSDFKTICSRTQSYFRRDSLSLKYIEKNIYSMYCEATSLGEKDLTLKKEYQINTSYQFPFIDGTLYDYIKRYNSETLPKKINLPTKADVDRITDECLESYSMYTRGISNKTRDHIVRCGIKACRHMNLTILDGESKYSLQRPKQSVMLTAKDTNSGWPYLKKKNNPECIRDTVKWLERLLNNPSLYSVYKNPLLTQPQVLFYRFQPSCTEDGEVDIKIRPVWAVPQRIVALEHMFFGNVIDRSLAENVSNIQPVYTSGLSTGNVSDRIVTRLRSYLKGNTFRTGYGLFSTDYSRYDRTIPDYAFDVFFSIMRDSFDLTPEQDKLYDLLRLYVKYSPYVHKGKVGFKRRGISSGSLLTNLFDSFWNLTLWYMASDIFYNHDEMYEEIVYKNGDYSNLDLLSYENIVIDKIPLLNSVAVCGDDTLIYTHERIVEIHSKICTSMMMKVGINVQLYSDVGNTYFLGCYWDENSRPVQSEQYMTAHIIVRTKYFKADELEFDISSRLHVYRIISIACKFYRGYEYVLKTFRDFPPMKDFLENDIGFFYIKDWPKVDGNYLFKDKASVLNWRNF